MESIELSSLTKNNYIDENDIIYIKSHKPSYYDSCLYYIDKGIITPIYTINNYYNSLPKSKKERLKGYIIDTTIDSLFHCAKIYSTYQLIRVFI